MCLRAFCLKRPSLKWPILCRVGRETLLTHSLIYISQGSVETHLWCGGICNNHIIANGPQSVSVKEFWKSIINWRRYGQK